MILQDRIQADPTLDAASEVLYGKGFEPEDLGGGLIGLVLTDTTRTYVVTPAESSDALLDLGVYTVEGWQEGAESLAFYADVADAAQVLMHLAIEGVAL